MRMDTHVDLGRIQIHTNVIADICQAALQDIEGVALARKEVLEYWAGLIGVHHNTAVDVLVDPNNQVSVVIRVNVHYGLNLADTSRRIQDAIMTAVMKMADVSLQDVNVNIQGIERSSVAS